MAKIPSVHVNDVDTCITVTAECKKGDTIVYNTADGTVYELVANEDIPIYHKAAIVDIKEGDYAYKYGYKIGKATQDIKKGDWVHIHNIKPVGMVK